MDDIAPKHRFMSAYEQVLFVLCCTCWLCIVLRLALLCASRRQKRSVVRASVPRGFVFLSMCCVSSALCALYLMVLLPLMAPVRLIWHVYNQKYESPDRAYQYILFAAEPYETIAFKVRRRFEPA